MFQEQWNLTDPHRFPQGNRLRQVPKQQTKPSQLHFFVNKDPATGDLNKRRFSLLYPTVITCLIPFSPIVAYQTPGAVAYLTFTNKNRPQTDHYSQPGG